MLRRFEVEQVIPKPVSEVFPFFSDAKNLEKITPPWLNFKVLDQSTAHIQEGTEFNYSLKIRGVPLKWRSKILQWSPNKQFMDIQLMGPYSRWEHLHTFEERDGQTVMKDIVDYQLPLGRLGDLCAGWYVKRDVEGIFQYRKRVIQDIFGRA